jgi:hypothetical protein
MVCDPSRNSFDIVVGPPPHLPGFQNPLVVPDLPFPDVNLPFGPEDLLSLMERLFALLPTGIRLDVNFDDFAKSAFDAIANLLNKLAPFLAFYKFIQALLNIILCIIDIFCALMNPWATVKAVKRLFKKCLPDFLALFPWLALILMILALILLLIALIEYIIQRIIDYIKQLLANIEVLRSAIQKHGEDDILKAVQKMSNLLCLIEQLFAILLAVAALFAIVRPLMDISGRSVCSKGGGGSSDDGDLTISACCSEDFCPDFIADYSPDGPVSITGKFIYQRQVNTAIPAEFSFLTTNSLTPLRPSRYQFIDDNSQGFKFSDIITPSPAGFIYWPEGESYDSNANILKVPYLLDMNLSVDPKIFGNPSDMLGERVFNIRDIIIKVKPTYNPYRWNNSFDTSITTGSVILGGGTVWELDATAPDGYRQYFINGTPATLESFIVREAISGVIPENDDSIYFPNVSYNLRYVYEVLIDRKLITLMCQPDLAIESAVFNAEFSDLRSVFMKVGELPNIGTLNSNRTGGTGTIGELATALTALRAGINEETAAAFQESAIASLTNLRDECTDFYCRGASAAADRFNSDFEISPDLQFVGQEIGVTVRLKDKSGTLLTSGISSEIGNCLAGIISATPSFGSITDFIYDGDNNFIAALSSDEPGTGELRAFINQEPISMVINRESAEHSAIIEKILTYEFVDATSISQMYVGIPGYDGYGPVVDGYVPVTVDNQGNVVYGQVIDNTITFTDEQGNIITLPITSTRNIPFDTNKKIRFTDKDIATNK